ncbi:hypothetical protein [Streptomyces sp. NPDC086776]|uniref:hypothetical protein n=1 Tax=Streptomyces sp. NPDC086776 TaxID=3365756 RepID=UPI00381C1FD4
MTEESAVLQGWAAGAVVVQADVDQVLVLAVHLVLPPRAQRCTRACAASERWRTPE